MRRTRSRRLTALIGAGSAALATWAVVGSPAATAASPAPRAAASATAASSSTDVQHVVVLLKNQHADLPAGKSTIAARVQATNADQAALIAKAKADGGTAIRQLHVANAFAVTISSAGVADLASDPAVSSVLPDRQLATTAGRRSITPFQMATASS